MSDPIDPTDPTTSTDLDATTVVPVPVEPVVQASATEPTGPVAAPLTPGPATDGPTNPVEQPVEAGVAWAAAVPVKPPAAGGRSRQRRLRWAAAIAVVAV